MKKSKKVLKKMSAILVAIVLIAGIVLGIPPLETQADYNNTVYLRFRFYGDNQNQANTFLEQNTFTVRRISTDTLYTASETRIETSDSYVEAVYIFNNFFYGDTEYDISNYDIRRNGVSFSNKPDGMISVGTLAPNPSLTYSFYIYAVNFYNEDTLYDTQYVFSKTCATPIQEPAKEGYVFDGWATEKDGDAKFDFGTPITSVTNLYASWHLHSYGEEWNSDETSHWKECACGDKIEVAEHIEDDGTVVKSPTETENGEKIYRCTVCDYERVEVIPKIEVEDEPDIEEPDNDEKEGELNFEIEKKNDVPDVTISASMSELADAILTDEEKILVENGAEIKLLLSVKNANNSVNTTEKEKVEMALGEYILGQYLDMELLKVINGDQTKMTSTFRPIRIVISIPDDLRGVENRVFAVIRVHNGVATVLEDKDTEPNTITIETDSFSTYVLVYRDVQTLVDTSGNAFNNISNNEPKTGENSYIELCIILAVVTGGFCLLIFLEQRKKKI